MVEPTGVVDLASGSDTSTDTATLSIRASMTNSGLIETSGDSDFLQGSSGSGSVTNEKPGTATIDGITTTRP